MPLRWALLLLLGLSARRGWGCLQCDNSVLMTLRQLRLAIIPSRFGEEHVRARALALLQGMEGPFFRDYAVNSFVGVVGTDNLDLVASFMKNQINNLMVNSLRDGPLLEQLVILREKVTMKLKTVLRLYELKGLMKEEVLDCLHCLKISPKCVTKKYCFVDRQPRVALQYNKKSGYLQNQAVLGIIVSVCLAVFAFGVIVASAITYRQNRKLLLR
ncbi:izumo sperm-egg fusion protein 2 [Molossus molossus]|uniref:izumo sperm-egg fusion protein 2 n=1 Tax=Molossus molossus TaxID=27622 RepID=UPI00174674C4|nr:izumo sperm-egg fusion protein 2 [Molossus molossus]